MTLTLAVYQNFGMLLQWHKNHRYTKNNLLQASGLSQGETNDLLDTYVREQVEEKGAGETHMCVHLLVGCQQLLSLCWLHLYLTAHPAVRSAFWQLI